MLPSTVDCVSGPAHCLIASSLVIIVGRARMWTRFVKNRGRASKRRFGSYIEVIQDEDIYNRKYPSFSTLVGVVPIAQIGVCDNFKVTLMSLESYADGFLVRSRFQFADLRSSQATAESPLRLDFRATDNCSRHYESWPTYIGHRLQRSMVIYFMPALNAQAKTLSMSILEPSRSTIQDYTLVRYSEVENMQPIWTFEVSLSGVPVKEISSPS